MAAKEGWSVFKVFRDALDSWRKALISAGIGTTPKEGDPVTPQDQRHVWDTAVLNPETNQGLLYIMYFYNWKVFGFRAKDEHGDLHLSQYRILWENGREWLQYSGCLAKNMTKILIRVQLPVLSSSTQTEPMPYVLCVCWRSICVWLRQKLLSTEGLLCVAPVLGMGVRISQSRGCWCICRRSLNWPELILLNAILLDTVAKWPVPQIYMPPISMNKP